MQRNTLFVDKYRNGTSSSSETKTEETRQSIIKWWLLEIASDMTNDHNKYQTTYAKVEKACQQQDSNLVIAEFNARSEASQLFFPLPNLSVAQIANEIPKEGMEVTINVNTNGKDSMFNGCRLKLHKNEGKYLSIGNPNDNNISSYIIGNVLFAPWSLAIGPQSDAFKLILDASPAPRSLCTIM